MLCSFQKLIFPKTRQEAENSVFRIAIYKLHDHVVDSQGDKIYDFKAMGYVPIVEGIRFDLQGNWTKSPQHGLQFDVDSYEEIIAPTREGIIAYLSSGLIKGIGKKTAERIYDAFGDKTLEMLDNRPEDLLKIRGISASRLKRIVNAYLSSRAARDVVAFLAPHGIKANRAVKIFREWGPSTISTIREYPYRLCELPGIGFKTADDIARSMGLDPLSGERIDAGLMQTLKNAEAKGNVCMGIQPFIQGCLDLLDTEGMTMEMVAGRALVLDNARKITRYHNMVYRDVMAATEQAVAGRVHEILAFGPVDIRLDIDAEIDRIQQKMKITVAPEQRAAIKTALSSHGCVITGGPGTGKSLILTFIMEIYRLAFTSGKIVCCAPTGRAAKRMEECTGHPASTIHKTLKLTPGEDGAFGKPEKIDADMVLVDEVSMQDIFITNLLLSALPYGCQIIFIGDVDQLPSVGPGAVLSDLITCGAIPVVKLDKVYRQSAGSRIAINAGFIRHGILNLEEGPDFKIIESPGFAQSAEIIEKIYLDEVYEFGADNVALLTPYRVKTETGVKALNTRLKDLVNPPSREKQEVKYGDKIFRVGDKVMQMKNNYDIMYTRPTGEQGFGTWNGDIGTVRKIGKKFDDTSVYVEFDDDRLAEFDYGDLDVLELAYAQTIHKSQGAEYTSVIINLQCGHYIMLNRPLIYTGITRAKYRLTFVGERKALITAIRRLDTEKRGTMLGVRINELYNTAA